MTRVLVPTTPLSGKLVRAWYIRCACCGIDGHSVEPTRREAEKTFRYCGYVKQGDKWVCEACKK